MNRFFVLVLSLFLFACSQQETVKKNERIYSASPVIDQPKIVATVPLFFEAPVFIPILMFHHIEAVGEDHPDKIYHGLSISPARFESMLQTIKSVGITTLSFDDLTAIETGDKPLPDKSILLSFDDGYKNNFTNAYPLLEKYELTGNFGIIYDLIGSSDFYADKAEIKKIAASHQICSHTLTHPDLTNIPENQLIKELEQSKIKLEALTQQQINCLIYPGGRHNQAAQDAVKSAGYKWARTTSRGTDIQVSNRFALPTIRIFPSSGSAVIRNLFPEVGTKVSMSSPIDIPSTTAE